MKKLMTMITAAMLLLSNSSFAAHAQEYVNEKALSAFAKDFSGATHVSWKDEENYFLVEFKVDERRFTAAYNEEGDLIASSKLILLDELPLTVRDAVNAKYPGYKVGINAEALTAGGKTNYLLTISDNVKVLHIKVTEKGRIKVEHKTDL